MSSSDTDAVELQPLEHEAIEFTRKPKARYYLSCARVGLGAFFVSLVVVCWVLFVFYRIGDQIVSIPALEQDNYTKIVQQYKKVASVMLESTNLSVDPCNDFYHYVCDGWTATHTLTPGHSRLAKSFSGLSEKNRVIIEEIVQERWPYLGTFYESCMDIESRSNFTGILADYELLFSATNTSGLMRSIAMLRAQRGLRGLSKILFQFDINLDLYNPQQKILVLSQAGYTLPTPAYYDQANQLINLQDYRQYIISMFALTPNSISTSKADAIIELERRLATANVVLDTFEQTYNIYTWTQFRQRIPNYVYNYVSALGWVSEAARQRVQISELGYFEQLRSIVSSTDIETLRNAAIFALLREAFPFMAHEYSDAAGALSRILDGSAQSTAPMQSLCAEHTNDVFPILMGHYFVNKIGMDAEFKERALEMALLQKEAVRYRLQQTPWMDVATIRAAEEKLDAMDVNVVYPDSWEQNQLLERLISVPLSQTNYLENVFYLRRSFDRLEFEQFSQPPNRNDWASAMLKLQGLSEVNAFYNPQNNSINIPAGIWQAPFYWDQDWTAVPPAIDFGGIGAVVSHEYFHSYDNTGRLFRKDGSLGNWWSTESAQAYAVKTQCIVDYYNQLKTDSGYSLNGLATLGEDIADIGGLRASLHAYSTYLESMDAQELSDMQSAVQNAFRGFTDKQLFFITYGQLWCELETPAAELEQIQSDPHPPAHQRLHGVLANVVEFKDAYGCAVGSNYAPTQVCEVF